MRNIFVNAYKLNSNDNLTICNPIVYPCYKLSKVCLAINNCKNCISQTHVSLVRTIDKKMNSSEGTRQIDFVTSGEKESKDNKIKRVATVS